MSARTTTGATTRTGASTSTSVLESLVAAARRVVDCDARPSGECAVYAGDGHYDALRRRLEEAEAYLAELARRPS